MKKVQAALVMLLLAGLACQAVNNAPEYFCEMRGGVWHTSTEDEAAYCEESAPGADQQNLNQTGAGSTESSTDIQACNATQFIQTQVEIIKNTKDQHYRECDYTLSATNSHPNEGVWIVRRTNTCFHNPAKDADSTCWNSDLLPSGQLWEKTFRATYFSDSQAGIEFVDKVAGVYNRPECLYLLNAPEVEAISVPVEWVCGP